MKKTLVLGLVAILSLGALTACSGGSSSTGRVIEVELGPDGEMAFNPPELNATKGEKITVRLSNNDSQTHSFVIKDFNATSGNVAAGKTKDLTFTASKTGEIAYYCAIPGHRDGGMEGVMHVK
jgi:nitrite reductase (NO-forming)